MSNSQEDYSQARLNLVLVIDLQSLHHLAKFPICSPHRALSVQKVPVLQMLQSNFLNFASALTFQGKLCTMDPT